MQTANKQFSTSPKLRFNMTNTLSNNQPMIYFEEFKDKGYGVMKLNRPPVNSLNLEFLTELNIQLDKIEQNKDINGVILTSTSPNVFSAGLDITEMYQCKRERFAQFWATFQDFFIKLYGSDKIFIAAINVRNYSFYVDAINHKMFFNLTGTRTSWWMYDCVVL